jgi:hypothetical protein
VSRTIFGFNGTALPKSEEPQPAMPSEIIHAYATSYIIIVLAGTQTTRFLSAGASAEDLQDALEFRHKNASPKSSFMQNLP